MSATSDLLKKSVSGSGSDNKSTVQSGKLSATASLLKASNANPNALAYVPKQEQPKVEPKKTFGSKVKDFGKALIEPVATTVARPIQAVAELAGATSQQVDQFSKDYLGGLVAPVPQNSGDVKKDIGRAVQTAAFGLPTRGLGAIVGGGAAFGVGSSLEQGNKLFSKQTAKEAAFGAGTGAVLHGAAALVSKVFSKGSKAVNAITPTVEEVAVKEAPKVLTPTEKFGAYSKKQGYEPYIPPEQLPTIDTGPTVKSNLPSIQFGEKTPTRLGSYTYEPIKPTTLPIGPIESTNQTVIPKINLPKSTKGTTIAKAASDVNSSLVNKGFEELPIEEQAKFNSVSRKQQVNDIARLIDSNEELAKDMVRGRAKIPTNIDPQILFNAIKNSAEKANDGELLTELAQSPIASQRSILAQKLGAAATLNSEHDTVKIIQDLNKIREKPVELAQESQNIKLAVEKHTPKTTRESLNEFIKTIPDC